MGVQSGRILLSKCALFRDEDKFIDVRLKVGEDIFPAHRIVLAANSDYFYAMFTDGMKESNQDVIELKDESISPDVLKIIMDTIYSENIHVNAENVFELLAAADHLQVTSVVQQCCDFLLTEFVQLRFDVINYCRVWTMADRHSLTELREAAEKKMASMYKDVCESEEFLSNIDAEELLSILSRDDLSAPSETFVFKSVIQWINYKKEERMAVAAQVIGAVRLGLVDIGMVIEELNTEEMQRVPEIHKDLHEVAIYKHLPSHSSKFALEKTKPRTTTQVLIAVSPKAQMQYFDVEIKAWKPLASTIPSINTSSCYHAVSDGSKLIVSGILRYPDGCIYFYDTESNVWEKLPHSCETNSNLCVLKGHLYVISTSLNKVAQRYNIAKRLWQRMAAVSLESYNQRACDNLAVLHSKIFVLYQDTFQSSGYWPPAVLRCFYPVKNKWVVKGSTRHPHHGSSPFIVNNRLYVAGVHVSIDRGCPGGKPAPVEVLNETDNTWSVVEQIHIPPNNLGAVEIEGRVYFIINKFPIDSGIRIPPEEVYPVHLGEWVI